MNKDQITNPSTIAWMNSNEHKAQAAVGLPFRIRTSAKTVVAGNISKVEVAGVRRRERSEIIQFKVWMVCGSAQVTKGPFIVERVPVR